MDLFKKILKWVGRIFGGAFVILVIVLAFYFYNLDKTNAVVEKIHNTKLQLDDAIGNMDNIGNKNTATVVLADIANEELVEKPREEIVVGKPKEENKKPVPKVVPKVIQTKKETFKATLSSATEVVSETVEKQVVTEVSSPVLVVPNISGLSTYPPQSLPPAPPAPPAPIPDTTPPVITITGNSLLSVKKNSVYTDAGATALDAVDGVVSVVTTGSVDTSINGAYILTYTATDVANNIATVTRTVKVATYVYIPQYTFGTSNGDGNNWQAWWFNGSEIYGWTDTYVGHYLREQFTVKQIAGSSCSNCLQRGIFNNNPQLGFESSDVSISSFNADFNAQTNNSGLLYDIDIQWDATGYTYTATNVVGNVVVDTNHVNISNVGQNMWVGWNGSSNNFTIFPSGTYMGILFPSSSYPWSGDYTGGSDMILQPFAVYVP